MKIQYPNRLFKIQGKEKPDTIIGPGRIYGLPFVRMFLSVALIIAVSYQTQAQFLHIGLNGSMKRMTFVSGVEPGDSTYTFYFANAENESFRFKGFEKQNNFSVAPTLYVRYSAKNNFFGEMNFSVYRPKAIVKYDNSVPFGTFNQTFNSTFDSLNNAIQVPPGEEYRYDKITLKWTFLEASLKGGYNFLRTKTIRPFVEAGLGVRYRMAMNLTDYPNDPSSQRDGRTKILYNNIDTFKNWTFYYSFGFGLRYHQISFNVFWGLTLGNIDIHTDKDQDVDFSIPDDELETEFANYSTADVYGFSLSIDLVSLNLTKKDVKQKIRTVRR